MTKTEEKQRPIYKRVFDILYYVVVVLIIAVALIYTIATLSSKDGVTSIFGYVLTSVQSDSMSGTFEKGDIIITKEFDVHTVQPDDIISFRYIEPQSNQGIIVTHRVIGLENNKIVTQGDVARSNNSADLIEYVSYGDVIAKYTGTKLSGVGRLADFVKTKVGFFSCVLIPALLFLFWQIYVFIKTLIDVRHLNKEKAINDQARALAEQMLKEMQKSDTANDNSSSSNDSEA